MKGNEMMTPTEVLARLEQEGQQLATCVNKLQDFMRTETFFKLDRVDKDLLYAQLHAMLDYLQILGQRLERANGTLKFTAEGRIQDE